jgi:hypothetical protein
LLYLSPPTTPLEPNQAFIILSTISFINYIDRSAPPPLTP